jgi:hypothetical protein
MKIIIRENTISLLNTPYKKYFKEKSNQPFKVWIDDKDKVIDLPFTKEHFSYAPSKSSTEEVKKNNWIRVHADQDDIYFDVKQLDNKTFKRLYVYYKNNLNNDDRGIYVHSYNDSKTKEYKSNFTEKQEVK